MLSSVNNLESFGKEITSSEFRPSLKKGFLNALFSPMYFRRYLDRKVSEKNLHNTTPILADSIHKFGVGLDYVAFGVYVSTAGVVLKESFIYLENLI